MTKKNNPEIRFPGFTEEWERRKLREFRYENDRYSFTGGPFGSDLKSSDYTDEGVRIIQLQNIGDGFFSDDYKIYTSEEKATSLSSNLIYPGEIIIAKMADPLARATIIPSFSDKYLMASDGIRLKVDEKKYNTYFVLTLINSNTFRKVALENSTGTTRKRIGLVTLGDLISYVPSIEEQNKIGQLFKNIDKTVAHHQRELDLLKETKKGFLQKMFPKEGEKVPEVRFPGFTEDWKQRKWFDTVNMSTDMVDPKTGKYDNLPHIGPGNIESFSGRILDNVKSVREDNLISGKFHFNSGDIIYGKINPQLAKYAYVNFEGLTSAETYVLKSHNGIAQDFLFVILQTKDFYKYSVSVSMRTGMPKINRDELKQYNYLAPSNINEQQKIGTFFKKLDDTITLHQRELDLLKETKKGFLQKLFV